MFSLSNECAYNVGKLNLNEENKKNWSESKKF